MTTNETPDHKQSGTDDDRECIDAIPREAFVLGIDDADRAHLFTTGARYEIWVLDADGRECVHHVGPTERAPTEWVEFVENKCGWSVRHRIELPGGAGLLADETLPPTRAEVIDA